MAAWFRNQDLVTISKVAMKFKLPVREKERLLSEEQKRTLFWVKGLKWKGNWNKSLEVAMSRYVEFWLTHGHGTWTCHFSGPFHHKKDKKNKTNTCDFAWLVSWDAVFESVRCRYLRKQEDEAIKAAEIERVTWQLVDEGPMKSHGLEKSADVLLDFDFPWTESQSNWANFPYMLRRRIQKTLGMDSVGRQLRNLDHLLLVLFRVTKDDDLKRN